MVELSTPIKSWIFHGIRLQSKGCRFNSCPFHFLPFFGRCFFIRKMAGRKTRTASSGLVVRVQAELQTRIPSRPNSLVTILMAFSRK